ncbi:uncharacterized protein si:ch211-276i12.4 [Solea solea]|uniref:uncharacterized protein si:ch211-276i12.4 n=1 Tax=Solea solea TaxID=90069 RepID=UPI00272AAD53|nr:uncharacterized protein si:ch211-276i12.4 [Solea solea]
MEMFFKPVHSPSTLDEIKPRRHHHHHQYHHDSQSHRSDGSSPSARYTLLDDTDKSANERHEHSHHHHHGHHLHDSPHHEAHRRHHTHQLPHSEEDEIHYNHHTPVTLSRSSSSSLSSSPSSTSSSSWYTEASANNPFSVLHAARPQHSLSCSNILDVRRGFQEDDSSEPVVFASIKHGTKGSVSHEIHGSSQQRHVYSSLDRGHSRSEEGPLNEINKECDLEGEYSRSSHMNGPLYKTASLNRSLAFSEEDILLGVSRGPKKAVSSSQLPSKGILKNRERPTDIRKAKSMEVLSPRVSKTQDLKGQKDKGVTQAEIEQARSNFVQGKLQFSAFLDEITKQVISPSDLTILGVNKSKSARKSLAPGLQTDSPIKPQLPPKKHRESSGDEREQHPKHQNRQEKLACTGTQNQLDFSSPDKLISYSARSHDGSPPPHTLPYSTNHNAHHGSRHKNRKPSPTGGSVQRDRFGRSGSHFTDGTSNSPEPSQPQQRHHRQKHPTASHLPHTQHFHQTPPQHVYPDSGHQRPASASSSSAQCAGAGHGSESSSTKSDSSRARDTASTATSHSSEKNGRHHSHMGMGHSKQCRDTLCEANHLQVLQEENADLQQNLLQTVVCIESLEAELQRTRDELSHVKEKYKSLLETHSGTKQANDLLGEHLHIASESLNSERKLLLNRVSQLSSELEASHRTIAALENINVPCLIKDLLEKHFSSAESIQKFVRASAPISCSATSPQGDGRSHTTKGDEESHDRLTSPETGPQRVTAFMPFKHGVPKTTAEASLSNQHESTHSQPDISTAIYKKMAAGYAARPKPLYPQIQQQQQPLVGTYQCDTPPNLQPTNVGGEFWGGEGGVKVTLLEHDIVDVTSMTAQQILNDFMEQLQVHKDVGGGTGPHVKQEWVGGAKQTGKMAD